MSENLTLSGIAKHFSDDAAAYELVERIRWPQGPVCPHCGSIDNATYLEPREGTRKTRIGNATYRRVWKCADCHQQFSVLVGTIFEDSHIALSKWLLAVHLMCSGKNGISAHELHRTLGITYKSAWFMAHRIREAMKRPPLVDKLQGIVEADETYVGGIEKGKRGRGASGKTPVFSLVERGGDVRSQVMHRVTGKNVKAVLKENVEKEATLMTDDLNVYKKPGKPFKAHETVNHTDGEYVRGNVHTNTVEGYFSQLKRGIDGTFHHVSEKHLPRYLAEFDYRYNSRKEKDGDRTEQTIRQSKGKRLTYKQPAGPLSVGGHE